MQTRRRKLNAYRLLPGGVAELDVNHGLVALIDAADLERVLRIHWYAKRIKEAWYVFGVLAGRHLIGLHNFILGVRRIDHKNRDPLDNRRSNLRPATYRQNSQNRALRRGSATPFKGVSCADGRWRAMITVDGTKRHLGCFGTSEEAARCYDDAARKAFGEFALVNFPDKPETVH